MLFEKVQGQRVTGFEADHVELFLIFKRIMTIDRIGPRCQTGILFSGTED